MWTFFKKFEYPGEGLEGMIRMKIPVTDGMAAWMFSLTQAGVGTIQRVLHMDGFVRGEDDFEVYIHQASRNANPRDVGKGLVCRTRVLWKTFFRKSAIRLLKTRFCISVILSDTAHVNRPKSAERMISGLGK